MPVATHGDITSTLSQEANGQIRGMRRYTFADGRERRVHLRAGSQAEWDARATTLIPEVEAEEAHLDAELEADDDAEIVDGTEATRANKAVAKLRKAFLKTSDHEAYLLIKRVNDYVQDLAISWNQVFTNHLEGTDGFTQSEFDEIKAYWLWLDANKAALNQAYTLIGTSPRNS